ncbi:YihY/virulence factor BrkB family protein [Formicincola oecophyllae]
MWRAVKAAMAGGQITLWAAGCAFFAMLSLFPAMSALISLYGLVFDLHTVEPQLAALKNLLPSSAYDLICNTIHALVEQPHSQLTVGLVISLVVALWSASVSSRSILQALNMAYDVKENRGYFHFQLLAFATTVMGVCGACMTLALMVAAPALLDWLPHLLGQVGLSMNQVPAWAQFMVQKSTFYILKYLAPGLLVLYVFIFVTLLYRYAPCRSNVKWRWIIPGSLVATLLWLLASDGFSIYVSHFANYSATYGPLSAVAAIMMWLFVSAYVVLFGAVIDSALERRARGAQASRAAHAATLAAQADKAS